MSIRVTQMAVPTQAPTFAVDDLPGICTVNRRDLLGNEAVGGRNLSNSGSHHIMRSGKGRARHLQAWE